MAIQLDKMIKRRKIIKQIGSVAIVAPFISLVSCGGGQADDVVADVDLTTDTATGSDGSTDTGSDGANDDSSDDTNTEDSGAWASGGTASMTANFPSDSLFETAAACALSLTGQQTQGPCYFATETLDDISEGQTGLPMQLCLRLIDSRCNPLAGMEIEVWHCDVEGVYSGDTSDSSDKSSFNSSFCTGNDSTALKAKWFRGIQTTDSNGRVNFKSCFPGWYASRAIHIHFRIKNNYNDELISQFGFDDDFCDDICATHVDYASHGTPDTHAARDTVFGSDYADYQFELSQNSDGSLLAWKTIQIS